MSDQQQRCRHTKSWAIAGGAFLWCYVCGAIRCVHPLNHWKRWQKPTNDPNAPDPWSTRTEEKAR